MNSNNNKKYYTNNKSNYRNKRRSKKNRSKNISRNIPIHEQLFQKIWSNVFLREEIFRNARGNDSGLDCDNYRLDKKISQLAVLLRRTRSHVDPCEFTFGSARRYHDICVSHKWMSKYKHFGLLVDKIMHPLYQAQPIDYSAIIEFLKHNHDYNVFVKLYNYKPELFSNVNGYIRYKTHRYTSQADNSKTIVDLACRSGSKQIVEYLLSKRYKIALDGVCNAVVSNSVDLVAFVLSLPYLRIARHVPLMNDAVSNSHFAMIKLLVENGYMHCDSNHLKLLFKRENYIQVLEYLVENCPHLFIKNNQALYSIAGKGHFELFKRLYIVVDKSTINRKLEDFIVASGNIELVKYYKTLVPSAYQKLSRRAMDVALVTGQYDALYFPTKTPTKDTLICAVRNGYWNVALNIIKEIPQGRLGYEHCDKIFLFGELIMNGQLELLVQCFNRIALPNLQDGRPNFTVNTSYLFKAFANKHYDELEYYLQHFRDNVITQSMLLLTLCKTKGSYDFLEFILKILAINVSVDSSFEIHIHPLIQCALHYGNHEYIQLIETYAPFQRVSYIPTFIAQTKTLLYGLDHKQSVGAIQLVPYGCRYSDCVSNFKFVTQNKSLDIHLTIKAFVTHFVSNNDAYMLGYIKDHHRDSLQKVDYFVCNRFCYGSKRIFANPRVMLQLLKDNQSLLYIHHLRINNLLVKDDFSSDQIKRLLEKSRDMNDSCSNKIPLSTLHYLERYKLVPIPLPNPPNTKPKTSNGRIPNQNSCEMVLKGYDISGKLAYFRLFEELYFKKQDDWVRVDAHTAPVGKDFQDTLRICGECTDTSMVPLLYTNLSIERNDNISHIRNAYCYENDDKYGENDRKRYENCREIPAHSIIRNAVPGYQLISDKYLLYKTLINLNSPYAVPTILFDKKGKQYVCSNSFNNVNENINNNVLFLKDPLKNKGEGIELFPNIESALEYIDQQHKQHEQQQSNNQEKFPRYLLQKEVIPKLLNGHKFDVRVNVVMVFNQKQTNVYLFDEYIVRSTSSQYIQTTGTTGNLEKKSQLTNFCYQINCDPNHKNIFLLSELADSDTMVASLEKATKHVFSNLIEKLNQLRHIGFSLFGLDFIFDQQGHPYLLEINYSPSMFQKSPDNVASACRKLLLSLPDLALNPLLNNQDPIETNFTHLLKYIYPTPNDDTDDDDFDLFK
ncbi:hypothetical protein CYY_003124 [Polysphondylium violaceum]|uniref:Tubulin--tyrosine ligase n=1 Tax=Polysphondylium violaceum TaxID=133409 RepID=A0A8J4Q775_9MYCE|nr:hypothetical protein CYY_003124 [Polysphondylium violaceum]